MAKIGMYGVYYAKAVVRNGIVVGYNGGPKLMGNAISADFSPNNPDDNPLYASNRVVENDSSGASGGTLKTVLDRLTMDAASDLYGLKAKTVKVRVGEDEVEGRSLDYTGLEQSSPVGVAYIRMNQEDSILSHEVVFYRRAVYFVPSEKAKTKEKKIEWQTPELEATVFGMEGDGKNPWYRSVVFPTQEAAMAFIEQLLSEEPPPESDDEKKEVTP